MEGNGWDVNLWIWEFGDLLICRFTDLPSGSSVPPLIYKFSNFQILKS